MANCSWIVRVALLLVTTLAASCETRSSGPTGPTSNPAPASNPVPAPPAPVRLETFEVSGIVTGVDGVPLADIPIVLRYYTENRRIEWSSATTNRAGDYAMTFASKPYANSLGTFAARAEIIASGYEWHYRDLVASGPRLLENFRLQRPLVIAAGGSASVDVAVGNGQCISGWMYGPCGRAHVTVSDPGSVTLAAMVNGVVADSLLIEACCTNGNEVYGNPVTVLIDAAMKEVTVEIGQKSQGVIKSQQVTLTTTIARF